MRAADTPGCRSARRARRSARRCSSSRWSLGREIIAPRTLSDGPGRRRAPLEVIISVRLLTRSGCARRQALRDHAAHRRAADMGLGDAERVEHADAVVRHVAERVRALDAQAEGVAQRVEREVGNAGGVEALAQADVAVVEADHAKAARRPAAATKSSCQPSSCMPRPMISSSGSPLRRAVVFDFEARCRWPRSASRGRGGGQAGGAHRLGHAGAEEPAPRAGHVERLPLRRSAAPAGRRWRRARAGSCPCRHGWRAPRCSRPAARARSGCSATRRCRRCASRSRSSAPAARIRICAITLRVADLAAAQQLVDAPGVGVCGWPVNGVPSVIDAARRARDAPWPSRGRRCRPGSSRSGSPAGRCGRRRSRMSAAQRSSTPSRGPKLKPWPQACVDVAEAAQEAAQRPGGDVVRAQPGKDQHRMAVAARQAAQPGQGGEHRDELERRAAFEQHQQGTRGTRRVVPVRAACGGRGLGMRSRRVEACGMVAAGPAVGRGRTP